MRYRDIWSVLSVCLLAAGGLVAGCDSDATVVKSAVGESCTRTADCADGLHCAQGTCYKSTTVVQPGTGGGEGNSAGSPEVVGPPPPVLGGPGESCTKAADCQSGLKCLSQRCTVMEEPMGTGGADSGPQLSGVGETCQLTTDCDKGLACLPGALPGGASAAGVGVCTPMDSGLTPSGQQCGRECNTAADCCELPVALHATLGAYSCADLEALIADITCASATAVNGERCLAYSAYCDAACGNKMWTCTDDGACEYAAKCTKATTVVGGCPPYTRGGTAIPVCDTTAGRCSTAAGTGCTTDASCFTPTPQVVTGGGGDTCSDGECACYKATGACYRKCSEDLDCPVGFSCNSKTALCMPLGACTTDAQCITLAGDTRVACIDGMCSKPPCEHDIDCNPGGLINGGFKFVCDKDHKCVSLGCESDAECPALTGPLAGGVRSFCGAPPQATTALPVSAITD